MTNEELVAEIQQGVNVQDNMQQLYFQNEPLITQTVKRYSTYEEMDDLKQEAYFGLQKAVEKYSFDENASFITYALFWVRSVVKRYVQNVGRIKRISVQMIENISKYKKFVNEYTATNSKKPTDEIICKGLGISIKQLENITKAEHEMNCISINSPLGESDGDGVLGDILASDENLEDHVIESVTLEEDAERIWYLVSQLKDAEREVVFGIYKHNKSMIELAEQMGVTHQRISAVNKSGISNLKRKSEIKKIAVDYGYYPGLYNGGVGRFKRTGMSSTEYCAIERTSRMEEWERVTKEIEALF